MQHDHDDVHRTGKFKLKIRHFLLAALALAILGGVLHVALLSSGVNRRLEALRAAGEPTSLAELALRNKLPMGIENAAPLYEDAFTAYVPPADDANVPYVGKLAESPDRKAAWPEPVAKAAAECLAANERCLALLHAAAGIETCRYDYDYRKGFSRFEELRRCVRLLKLAAVDRARNGDPEGAVNYVKDGLALAGSLHEEPQIISFLVQLACDGETVRSLERALSLATFTDAQLRDLDGALAGAAAKIDLVRALEGERCFLIDGIRDPSLIGMPGPGTAIFKVPGVRSRGLIDILDYMAECIEAAKLPPEQRTARLRDAGASLDSLSHWHLIAKMMAPALSRISELDLRARVHLDLARTGLAIERYRLANGKPPAQLSDLVPTHLDQVAIDPFDGQPIRYRRTEPGYILYSIREDGQDNGGKEQHEVGKGEPYDLCFIVARQGLARFKGYLRSLVRNCRASLCFDCRSETDRILLCLRIPEDFEVDSVSNGTAVPVEVHRRRTSNVPWSK